MPKKKEKLENVDGLGPKDKKRLRTAIRGVWTWNYARRLCVDRAATPEGFSICELCKRLVAKVYADHIKPVGEFSEGFIERMFVSSKELQALCKKCHDKKTREERKKR